MVPALKLPVSILAYYTLPLSELPHFSLYFSRIHNRPWFQLQYQQLKALSIALEVKYKLETLSFKVHCLKSQLPCSGLYRSFTLCSCHPYFCHLPFSALALLLLSRLATIFLPSCPVIHNNFTVNMLFRTHFD